MSRFKSIEPNDSMSKKKGNGGWTTMTQDGDRTLSKGERKVGGADFTFLHFMYRQLVFQTGYEVHGMEKIPEGPALIIFYHGAIPIDFYYFMAKIFIHKGRTCRVVADHFVFKIPGFSLLLDVFCALHGPREKCVEILKSGHLLAISPGGVREALLSDETYNIIWGNRKGFAQVAIDAKVPIIPMFTQNIREGFRSLGGTRLFKWLYEKFRYPFAPMYGGFPVKLRTFLGDPIPYDPKITAEELAEKTKNAVQALIDKHQRIPGNIRSALLERFHREQKAN
ncbi:hypothetical protein STEG23_037900 [Scotinomys teguina]